MKDRVKGKSLTQLSRAALRLMHPSLAMTVMRDKLSWERKSADTRTHLDATMQWLSRAQDVSGGAGVSTGYSIMHGWLPPYPETTGYIIPTFYDYADLTGREEYRDRARRMADWEIEVQLPSGAVQAGAYYGPQSKRSPAAFNTGQVILGWCRAYLETRDERYLTAARRAGDWLVNAQSKDGAWRLAGKETETTVHAYDIRNSWSLLEIFKITNDRRLADAARANCEWTLSQQIENGWFENNAFFVSFGKWTSNPFTHTIAYVMEGLQECWRLLGEDRYLLAVYKTADQLLKIFDANKFMAGEFDRNWKTKASYSCLTGDAQIAGVWLRLFLSHRDVRFLRGAIKLNDFVKGAQDIRSIHSGTRGGVKGSHPIDGGYTPFVYVNWGAKFLADTLMLEEQAKSEYRQEVEPGSDQSEVEALA